MVTKLGDDIFYLITYGALRTDRCMVKPLKKVMTFRLVRQFRGYRAKILNGSV